MKVFMQPSPFSLPRPLSAEFFAKARRILVGGVNSPVRAFRGVQGGVPVFPRKGKGAYITDIEGHRYLDYVLSYGPLILGHAHPRVVSAVRKAIARGTSFGMTTEVEVEFALTLQRFFPELEKVRLVSSGTEAAMSAIRLARGYTRREKIVKFTGCYHGHADSLLVRAGSGVLTLGVEGSRGVTRGAIADTYLLPFNDPRALSDLLEREGERIACVILEVIPCNAGMILPEPEFVEVLKTLPRYGILLIADEVLTGMRIKKGGAYHLYGLKPDLVLLGKVIGGGFPLAGYGGRGEIMEHLAPLGEVYQAGTLSGNPVAVTAGLETLRILEEEDPYPRLEAYTRSLAREMEEEARRSGIPLAVVSMGSIFSIFFGRNTPPRSEEEVRACDHTAYAQHFWGMLYGGIHLPPSGYEVCFTSTAHGDRERDRTLRAFRQVLKNWGRIPFPSESV
jgi:glutamate-1-semialdehyde 2,1-aminomutase